MTFFWATIFVLGGLVFIHELGHYLAARSVGIRVERFSVGFPPRFITMTSLDNAWEFSIFFYKRTASGRLKWGPVFTSRILRQGKVGSTTEYCLALIPLGGYVKMAGIIDESMDTEIKHEPDEFMSKSNLAKIWVMSAGVIMNIITAFIIFSGVAYIQGYPEVSTEPIIAEIRKNMPAEESGLRAGDRIISINNEQIQTWQDITEKIHVLPETKIELGYEREGVSHSINMTTSFQQIPTKNGIDTLGAIGIAPKFNYRPVSLGESMQAGITSTVNSFALIVMSIHMLITGEASMDDMGGPIMIAQLAGETAQAGWIPLLTFMAMLSVNLAFINIVPIPGLDGGHIFILLIESVLRKPLSLKARMIIQQIGMAFLLLLMVTVIFNDVTRLFN